MAASTSTSMAERWWAQLNAGAKARAGKGPWCLPMGQCCWITSGYRWSMRSIVSIRCANWISAAVRTVISLFMKSLQRRMYWIGWRASTCVFSKGCDPYAPPDPGYLSASVEHHHGLAPDVHQVSFFERLEYAPDHFSSTSDDASDFLAGDFYLHAVRVSHRVWLFAQLYQGCGYAAGGVQKRKISYFKCGIAQAFRHLASE